MNDYHADRALETANMRRLKKVEDAAAEAEARWQRRILPLLQSELPDEGNFKEDSW